MLLWWKEYAKEWRTSLFLVLEMVLVLFWVNARVSDCVSEYGALSFAEVTDSNMYFYQNAIGVLRDDLGYEGFRHAEEKLRQMDGLEEVAYETSVGCMVEGYQNSAEDAFGEIVHRNLSPQMWKGLQYRLGSGRWFNGQDAEDGILQVIIGGGLSKKYQVGDTITINYDQYGIRKEALVVGVLAEGFYLLEESFGIGGKYLASYAGGPYKDRCDFILSNDTVWEEEVRDLAEYPYLSVMVKLKEGTDLSVYKKYGVLASFDEVMANTRERCRGFIWEAINDNAIWILVIIFGVFGTSYITARNRRYSWGIYSLLGMTGNELLRRLMLQNALTYLLGGIVACVAAPHLSRLLNYEYYGFGIENAIATGALIAVLFAVSYLCNWYIRWIEPKEILNQVKE